MNVFAECASCSKNISLYFYHYNSTNEYYCYYHFLNLFLINLCSHSTGQCLFGQFPT